MRSARRTCLGSGLGETEEVGKIIYAVVRAQVEISSKGCNGMTPSDEITVFLQTTLGMPGSKFEQIALAVQHAVF